MSDLPLALRYRPRTFSDIVGQRAPRVVLASMIRSGNVFPALLLHGSHGSGKTSTARVFVAALNCEAEDPAERPCGKCSSCVAIALGTSSDVVEVDAASSGLADDIRKLREQVRYAAASRYRAVILDEAHGMSEKGSEALLKTLEEPPPQTVFVLVTTELGRIRDTIASRCRSLEFRRVTEEEVSARLIAIAQNETEAGRHMAMSPQLADAIAARTRGILRDAVNLAEQCALVGLSSPESLTQLVGRADYGLQVLTSLTGGTGENAGPDLPAALTAAHTALEVLPSPGELVAALVAALRRTLVLASGSEVLTPPPTAAERVVAARVSVAQCVAAMRVVWEYVARVAPTTDAYASMDMLVTLMGQAFKPRGG